MNTENYTKKFSSDESRVVAIDFDGVIHNDFMGFHDGTIYGDPIEGSIESIKTLNEMGYVIKIYSCKCNPSRPLINGKDGKKLIFEWLKKHKVSKFIDEITWGKPHAIVYIDDKGYRFENWSKAVKFMEKIK